MNQHPNEKISAFLDGVLTGAERDAVGHHLSRCERCAAEAEAITAISLRFSRIPRHEAPAALMRKLKREYVGPWWAPLLARLSPIGVWKPVAAFGLAAFAAAFLLVHEPSSNDGITTEDLMAAHSRYAAESLVPADPVASDFSARLAVFYGDRSQ